MKLLHLSDLHFGRERPDLLEPLLSEVNRLAPDLVAISGDLTQRARIHQMQAARAFVARIEAPVLAVPGNHDVPLDNPVLRFLAPWRRYRRDFGGPLEQVWRGPAALVVGVNTVNPFAWQSGRIGRRAVRRVCDAFSGSGADGTVRVVVAHHPFEHVPGERKRPMRGALDAIRRLAGCGADVVLSGHLHSWRAEPFLAAGSTGGGVILVQAGTGLSTRVRGEPNDFNLLHLSRDRIAVERFAAGDERLQFRLIDDRRFRRGADGWQAACRLPAAEAATGPAHAGGRSATPSPARRRRSRG